MTAVTAGQSRDKNCSNLNMWHSVLQNSTTVMKHSLLDCTIYTHIFKARLHQILVSFFGSRCLWFPQGKFSTTDALDLYFQNKWFFSLIVLFRLKKKKHSFSLPIWDYSLVSYKVVKHKPESNITLVLNSLKTNISENTSFLTWMPNIHSRTWLLQLGLSLPFTTSQIFKLLCLKYFSLLLLFSSRMKTVITNCTEIMVLWYQGEKHFK